MTYRPPLAPARMVLVGAALTLLAGCAGAPLDAGAVDEARARYAAASDTPHMTDFAGSSLRQAQRHLAAAEQMLEASGSQAAVDHHGFMAQQYLAIAEARLARGLAQRKLGEARRAQQDLVLEAQRREAAAAARRAEEMEGELSDIRMKLRMSEQRAQALAERLVKAGVTDSLKPE